MHSIKDPPTPTPRNKLGSHGSTGDGVSGQAVQFEGGSLAQ